MPRPQRCKYCRKPARHEIDGAPHCCDCYTLAFENCANIKSIPVPFAPPKPCPRCGRLNCTEHNILREQRRESDQRRGSAHSRGYTKAWARYSANRLKQPEYRFCVDPCGFHPNQIVVADVTDHIKSAREHPELFWDPTNHQSLCHQCHNHKTAIEDGGFGKSRVINGMGGGQNP